MNWPLIFSIPLAALGVATWSAWQVQQGAAPANAIVMMLPTEDLPALNPFLPTGEAERQILDLLHEPLIRLDGQGRPAPGLAATWGWHQRVSCWFPSLDALREAQRLLAEVPEEMRQIWELQEVTTEGLTLVLRFAEPGAIGVKEALQTLSNPLPLPLTFLRVEGPATLKPLLQEFAQEPQHADGLLRLWFDENGTCELVTTRSLFQIREALSAWCVGKNRPVPRITPFAEVAALVEPMLDFELNVSRALWPDGSPVTAADVRATVEHVTAVGYPVPGREGFRHIQAITAQGSTAVRVTYRRSYGAALAGWIGFPILPESWLKKHPQGAAQPPPGAGDWQVKTHTAGRITLQPRPEAETPEKPTLQVIPATPALQARVALSTGTLDIVWPGADPELRAESGLDLHPAAPRNRLLVLCNVRSSRLSELPVREALFQALDRDSLRAEGLGGQARLAEPLFTPGLWYAPPMGGATYDLPMAQQKLEAAGWLKDVSGIAKKGGQSLDFELLITTGNPQRERLARRLGELWWQLGARVKITAVPPELLVAEHLAPGKFDAALIGLDYETAWDQTALWHSGQTESGLNFSRLADPQLDLLLEALAGEFDIAQLPARAEAVQDRFTALQPALPVIGDLEQIGLRHARFPHLEKPDIARPLTLRSLLRNSGAASLQMRPPNE